MLFKQNIEATYDDHHQIIEILNDDFSVKEFSFIKSSLSKKTRFLEFSLWGLFLGLIINVLRYFDLLKQLLFTKFIWHILLDTIPFILLVGLLGLVYQSRSIKVILKREQQYYRLNLSFDKYSNLIKEIKKI